jgi:hypothetical protein
LLPIWQKALNYAKFYNFDQGMYSNGLLIKTEDISFLDKILKWLYVSVHGDEHPLTGKVFNKAICTAGILVSKQNYTKILNQLNSSTWKTPYLASSPWKYLDLRPLIVPGDDYKWVEDFIAGLPIQAYENPKIKISWYKFRDLASDNFGKNYTQCLATRFTACIGADGHLWECVNRRKISDLGDLRKERLRDCWNRFAQTPPRTCFDGCRELCRNHELNKTLNEIFVEARNIPNEFKNFV